MTIRDEDKLGPFTLEEAKDLILQLEDIATTERELGEATRFLFVSILKELHRGGIFNVNQWLDKIDIDNSGTAGQQLSHPGKITLGVLMELIRQELQRQENESRH